MTKVGAFLAGFAIAAAAAAGAGWLVLSPKWGAFEERTLVAERASQRAKRDAVDREAWAEHEHRLKLEMEEELSNLKRAFSAAPPKERAMPDGHKPDPLEGALSPEQWDWPMRSQRIQTLSALQGPITGSPVYPLLVRAVRAHAGEDVVNLSRIVTSELDPPMRSVAATLLGALGDARGMKPLLAAWSAAKDPELQKSLLRGLANVPGDEATPILLGVWNDPESGAQARLLVLHGLARRRHPVALAVAQGGAPGSTPPLRLQSLQTLHSQALDGGWKETALVPLFGKALRTADGDPQRKLDLLALEGFWSKDSIADLETFADSAVSTELAARARRTADALRAGMPRPEGAGVPPQTPGDADAAPPAPASVPENREPPK